MFQKKIKKLNQIIYKIIKEKWTEPFDSLTTHSAFHPNRHQVHSFSLCHILAFQLCKSQMFHIGIKKTIHSDVLSMMEVPVGCLVQRSKPLGSPVCERNHYGKSKRKIYFENQFALTGAPVNKEKKNFCFNPTVESETHSILRTYSLVRRSKTYSRRLSDGHIVPIQSSSSFTA